jgi:hypothetical protein
MATSGQISGLMTAQGFIVAAMEDLGILNAGELPAAEEAETARVRLNWLLKSLQARGCNLWRDTDGTATFPAGDGTVTLSPRVLDVMDCRAVLTGGTERWLTRWEAGEYRRIPNKATQGSPAAFTINRGRDAVTMTLWPVPSVETDVNYAYARVIEDVVTLTENVDVPQEWTETIWKLLARALIPTFGIEALDPATAARVTAGAEILERRLLDFDRPASVFAGPVRRRWMRS